MKFLKNIEVIILLLIIIIIASLIAARLSPIANLSPKLEPKCILNGVEIKANPSCSHEEALTKRPCISENPDNIGTCKYYS